MGARAPSDRPHQRTIELAIHVETTELKTALFASIGHDLMTRLTVIQAAASNLKALQLSADDRVEHSDMILGEAERLRRLFQNIVEMVRIDGAATSPERRWALPSEIIHAARRQVEHTLEHRPVEVGVENDEPIHLDQRLTTKALAHLLENAAQYAPPGSAIRIDAREREDGLEISVSDRGPGIAPIDLPHVFDRFYRGMAARARVSGTGMGLWIARELLAVQGGRVCAANRPNGGAVFTVVVPASLSADRLESGTSK
jgi:two-component system sensor histidine kinase KdpD